MDDLVVDGELATLIVDDENTDATTAVVERINEAVEQAALVEHRKALLDITSLGHGNNAAVVTDVKNTVLLEDRTDHVLNNDRWAWVADEGRLLVQLLGEEVNTKVAVLASLSGSGDADDLAWAALQDEEVANADVVAWNGDGVWGTHWAGVASRRVLALTWGTHGDFAVLDNNVFLTFNTTVVTALVALEWVQDAVGSAVKTVTEGVVVAVFVVISHVKAVTTTFFWCVDGLIFDSDFVAEANGLTLGVTVSWVLTWVGRLVLPTTRSSVLLGEWGGAVTVVPLGDVDAGIKVDLGSWGVTSWVLAVVDAVLNVNLCVGVPLVRLPVAMFDGMSAAVMPVVKVARTVMMGHDRETVMGKGASVAQTTTH